MVDPNGTSLNLSADAVVPELGERIPSMHNQSRGFDMLFRKTIIIGALAVTAIASAATGAWAAAPDSTGRLVPVLAPSVPVEIVPPAGNSLTASFAATGVQIYQCTAGAWVFLEPAANLVGATTHPVRAQTAIHFRTPSWESTSDGSLVTATAVASAFVNGSIPQLLLRATGNRGDGVFGRVTYIQRLNTRGGLAPAGTCTDGQTTSVFYHAVYRFFVAG
jgi:hypothetical protein